MAILRNESKKQYTVINQSIIMDEKLSLKGLGLLVHLLSMPDNWKFSEEGLLAMFKQDGITSTRTAKKELEELGYLVIRRLVKENGKFNGYEWIIKENPENE